ncbi:hypothetical protein AtubIFM55763_010017 [Aspergillus tubingensis]|uniref:Uncharacterized protein n=4 Tax=Aspergillus subgen. Circumdati TaxID=2720871 RepID=A0A8G1VMX5_9EURO|nr:hypothetical protein BO85DRAFT_291002 [Aspergillus piperis CBS 112811]XP_025567166.1 hypothetical protein BO88DRAFT_400993 [Aspergillus vadensis CBS 113365]XP_035354160.1 major facilitator superfamily protein [Aspergillus tubingensis]GAQ38243.1 similar to An04g07430 [Aspergillus niger]PYH73372.1 hypothetical protein BO88DRAFT_400993 [Aspergillus vadensis CBS 113365]RAH57982.1 hypothetical protein BO85DRAFT_291002 [Aspergillus piperis CBS 112811]GFN13356.1 major facilitator superfamily prot
MPAKPILHPLRTPKNMTFPSELQPDNGVRLGAPGKQQDESLSTPITPPAAYTEFLKSFTPVFTPDGNGGTVTRFVWDKANKTPTSQPASAVSGSFSFPEPTRPATATLPPPSPYGSAPHGRDMMSLRRLRIPPPMRYSPTLETPRSATTPVLSPYSYSYSPADWKMRYWDGPRSATVGRVSVRHVVTHTVTYKRTQLEDPPKGKRRKHNETKQEEEEEEDS